MITSHTTKRDRSYARKDSSYTTRSESVGACTQVHQEVPSSVSKHTAAMVIIFFIKKFLTSSTKLALL